MAELNELAEGMWPGFKEEQFLDNLLFQCDSWIN